MTDKMFDVSAWHHLYKMKNEEGDTENERERLIHEHTDMYTEKKATNFDLKLY